MTGPSYYIYSVGSSDMVTYNNIMTDWHNNPAQCEARREAKVRPVVVLDSNIVLTQISSNTWSIY